jgi:amino acid transporter
VLLLAAASSSFQAGPGLLKALARGAGERSGVGVLPGPLGAANRHHTPYWGVVVFLCVAGTVVTAAGGREQELVLFYAVAVFMSFLFGLLSMALLSHREGVRLFLVLNALAIVAVVITLAVNLRRGYPIASLGAACTIALVLHRLWIRAGRPRGVSEVERIAEADLASAP